MKSHRSPWTALLAALSILAVSASPALADTTTNAPDAKPIKAKAAKKAEKAVEKAKEGKPYPFHGTVAAVDKKAMTFTLEGKDKPRVIGLNSKSLIEKDNKPATLGQIMVGDYAHGRLEKQGDEEFLVKAAVGAKPEKKAADDKTEAAPKHTKKEKKTEAVAK